MKLLPRKEFEITLKGETYRGKFGSYAIKLFCNYKGLELEEVAASIDQKEGFLKQQEEILLFICCALEASAESDRKKIDIRPIDLYNAIDDKDVTYDDLVKVYNHSASEGIKNVNGESQSAGVISNDIIMQPEESLMSSGA